MIMDYLLKNLKFMSFKCNFNATLNYKQCTKKQNLKLIK